jgi:hypothetical protein
MRSKQIHPRARVEDSLFTLGDFTGSLRLCWQGRYNFLAINRMYIANRPDFRALMVTSCFRIVFPELYAVVEI